jgi:hypothetical protein
MPRHSWLHPVGNTGAQLVRILSVAREQRRDYVEFMIHSSELMAGGSPWFTTQDDIELVYEGLEALFHASTQDWQGRTLSEYHDVHCGAGDNGSLRGSTDELADKVDEAARPAALAGPGVPVDRTSHRRSCRSNP